MKAADNSWWHNYVHSSLLQKNIVVFVVERKKRRKMMEKLKIFKLFWKTLSSKTHQNPENDRKALFFTNYY